MTSNSNELWQLHEHFVPYLFTPGASASQELLAHLERAGLTVRTLRGSKMRQKSALFDEFSAALQFPLHFGENWDAFYDCISDLQWLTPRRGYILMITEPEELLIDEELGELNTFLETLRDAHARFTAPAKQDGTDAEPVPFHVVLISQDTDNPRLSQWEEILQQPFQ